MTHRPVELRSDTFTRPTGSMRKAMYEAEVGDDVWDEDPTVDRLEEQAASLTGKEAGLFVSSGTQGNLVGVLSHCSPGDELILGDRSHLFVNEVAGAAVVGGLQMRTLPNLPDGGLEPAAVRAAIRGQDIHWPTTGCLAIENTHNLCGGKALSPMRLEAVSAVAHTRGVPVHLDGARIFNAAAALAVPATTLTRHADSVTFCLSKGLGAPVGSILCGSREYIARARRWRKMLGGGMRQVGVLAAAGLVALNDNIDRLPEDHANARALAEGLATIPGITVNPEDVDTNIVFFDIAGLSIDPQVFFREAWDNSVRLGADGTSFRAVTSYEVDGADIQYALRVIETVARAASPVLA